MASTVTRRNPDGSKTTTTFKGGKPVSSVTTPKNSSKGGSGGSSSNKKDRFVPGKGGTVKDTKTNTTFVPDRSKGETQQSLLNKKRSGGSSKPKENISPKEPVIPKPQTSQKNQPRFFDVTSQTFFPDEPQKTAFFKSQAAQPVARNVLTPKRLQGLVNEANKPSFLDKSREFVASPLRGGVKTSQFLGETLTKRPTGEGVALASAILTQDKSFDTSKIRESNINRTRDLRNIAGDRDIQNFVALGVGTKAGVSFSSKVGGGVVAKSVTAPIITSSIAREGIQAVPKIPFIGSSKLQREISQDISFKQAVSQAEAKTRSEFFQDEKFELKDFVVPFGDRRIRGFVPSVTEFETKKQFEANLRSQLKLQGFKGKELEEAIKEAKRQRAFLAGSELGGALAGEATTERIGSRLFDIDLVQDVTIAKGLTVPQALSGKALNKQAFRVIAPLGFGEAASEVITQADVRGTAPNLRDVVGVGLVGGFGAGKFGAGIVSSKNPLERSSRQLFGDIVDPLEKPGDIISDFAGSLSRRRATANINSEIRNIVRTPSSFFSTSSNKQDPGLKLNSFLNTRTTTKPLDITTSSNFANINLFPEIGLPSINNNVNIFSPELPTSNVNIFKESNVLKDIFVTELPTKTNTNTQTEINIDSFVNNNQNVLSNVNINENVLTNVNVNTNVNVPNKVPSNINIPIIPLPPLIIPKGSKGKNQFEGYYTKVKTKGKFKRINNQPVPLEDAIKLGKFVTENSVAATFKPVKANKKTSKRLNLPNIPKSQFNVKKGVWTEKNQFRINTAGELAGITAKGLLKQRFKNIKL